MSLQIALSCLLVLAYANEESEVLKSQQEVNLDGYNYLWQLSNSANVQQEGKLNGDALVVSGQHSYTSPEGTPVAIKYVADENGFQVLSAEPPLPTPPPIPEAILKAIKYIEAHPPKPE
ncbi:hypothetical protein KR222_008181 [Zaprionus bogoriensis]|nr:hypothetical protein KR222_008181 [Zaprionus bogoriensis]